MTYSFFSQKPVRESRQTETTPEKDRPIEPNSSDASIPHTIDQHQRQHPVAILSIAARTLKEIIVPVVVLVIAGGSSANYIVLLVPVFLILVGFFIWLRFTWRIKDDELQIKQGVFVRKRKYLHRDRIQAIDVSSGPIQRLFGLVRVTVLTAGGNAPEAEISAISIDKAREIEQALNLQEKNAEQSNESTTPDHRLNHKRLIIAASTAASFGVALSIVGTLFSQINQFITTEQLAEFVEEYAFFLSANAWFYIVFLAISLAWIISVVSTVLRFYGFTLSRNEKEIRIKRGLFEKKEITIPYHRIQSIRIVEGILRQPFGFAMVYIDNAGLGDDGGKTSVLFPLIHRSELNQFINTFLPGYHRKIQCVTPPARAFLRYQIKTGAPILIVTSIIAWALSLWFIIPIVILPSLILAYARYRDAAAGFDSTHGLMQYRNLARNTILFEQNRLQSLSVHANWFQRRKQLCSLSITVASGGGGSVYGVDHLSESVQKQWFDWYSDKQTLFYPTNSAGKWPNWLRLTSSEEPVSKAT